MATRPEMEFPPFDVSLNDLKSLMEFSGNEAREKIYNYYGGTEGLCKRLQTDPNNGIAGNLEELNRRRNVFGTNQIPEHPPKSFLTDYDYENSKINDELIISEIGLLISFNIVLVIKACIDYKAERKFRDLQGKINCQNKFVVVRDGQQISVIETELAVGDIVLIKHGDRIPADGVIIDSNKLNIDESLHNGSSDNVKKSVESCPVVFTGTNVVGGDGRILIIAVGVNSQNGVILTLLRKIESNIKNRKKNKSKSSNIKRDEENQQPLLGSDEKFKNGTYNSDIVLTKIENELSTRIEIIWGKLIQVFLYCLCFGLIFAIIIVIITLLRFFIGQYVFDSQITRSDLFKILSILFTGLTFLLSSFPVGIPLSVLISIEYSASKMKKDNYLTKNFYQCETLGNVTNICFDKTGTLTNKSDAGQTLCDDVPKTISVCQQAGIDVRMVTGDNIITARSVAMSCGILKPGDDYLVLEAKEFNERICDIDGELSQEKLDQIWPKLRVLADAKPIDKYNLVKGIIDSKINKNREIVAFVGDGTNDCLALKRAHIGVVMAKSSTYLAKEASDLIITGDNFNSLIKAIFWGRHIYDSITKILQFNLIVFFVEIVLVFGGSLLSLDILKVV
ncbi:unnamed protein product [Meloidogyne enterolobii]|uniref:Uncharacterized protein n=1 Tax=Meloidogyne enterolobii TaxID=390850 RepID=A0ACB0XRM0_MELEN